MPAPKVDVSTIFLGIIATILIAAIPLAYDTHGRLVRVETTLSTVLEMHDKLHELETRVIRLEPRN